MNILSVSNLSIIKPHSKRNKGKPSEMLLDNINFELNAGEIITIIGPNGAGKSTLLKAIAGDLDFANWQYTGKLSMPLIANINDAKTRARQLAVLPQFSLLNFPYRVSEVVGLSRTPHQTGRSRDLEIIDAALELMDIGFLKNHLYTKLSGGEKQRVQLARVLAQIWEPINEQPRLLLLDEPTTALDLGHQRDLMRAVKKISTQGVGVLMVLHDINLAARYADRILALLCSQQVAFDIPTKVITTDRVKRLFNIDAKILAHPDNGSPIVVST